VTRCHRCSTIPVIIRGDTATSIFEGLAIDHQYEVIMLKNNSVKRGLAARFILPSLFIARPVCARSALGQDLGALRVIVVDASTQRR
jgi:hypothetical protein